MLNVANNIIDDEIALMNFYTKFQSENKIWVERNFHTQCFAVAHEPLLGMIEEIGELYTTDKDDALTLTAFVSAEDRFIDACGDIMVFMCDYCSCVGFVLYDLVNKAKTTTPFAKLIVADEYLEEQHILLIKTLGKLSHAHLKLTQNIRVNENHIINIEESLIMLIKYIIWSLSCLDTKEITLEECISRVWEQVKQRDWVKNKVNGE
jgi:hypothetical protein